MPVCLDVVPLSLRDPLAVAGGVGDQEGPEDEPRAGGRAGGEEDPLPAQAGGEDAAHRQHHGGAGLVACGGWEVEVEVVMKVKVEVKVEVRKGKERITSCVFHLGRHVSK